MTFSAACSQRYAALRLPVLARTVASSRSVFAMRNMFAMPIRIVTELAWHSLFVKQLFRRGTPEQLANHVPEWTVINACKLLADPKITKLFHFARFDIAVLYFAFGTMAAPLYCTKIASKLVRTYTDRHGLKDLVRELLGIDLSKQQQSSDWAAETLSEAQIAYAASDVLHLHALREKLDAMLIRDGRSDLAAACFAFLPARARLDLMGWEADIFSHE